jgi:hypothetical protein
LHLREGEVKFKEDFVSGFSNYTKNNERYTTLFASFNSSQQVMEKTDAQYLGQLLAKLQKDSAWHNCDPT